MTGGIPESGDDLDGVAWSPADRGRVTRSTLLLALAVGASLAVVLGWSWLAAAFGGGVPWIAVLVGAWVLTAFVAVAAHRLWSDLRAEPPSLLRVVLVVYVGTVVLLGAALLVASGG
jgi:hypothetical protein